MSVERRKLGIIVSPLDKTIFIDQGPALYFYNESKRKFSATDRDILKMLDPDLPHDYNVLTAVYSGGEDIVSMVKHGLNMLYMAQEVLGVTEWIKLELRMDRLESKYSESLNDSNDILNN